MALLLLLANAPAEGASVAYPTRQVSSATFGFSENPSVNADGTLIAFRSTSRIGSNTDGNDEICLFDRSTGLVSQLTDSEECDNGPPQISADGTRIVFDSECDLVRPRCRPRCPDGSPCSTIGSFCPPIGLCVFACPDGSGCTGVCPGDNADGSSEIFSVDTASGVISQLTDSVCDHYEPVINADGTRVAFHLDCGFGLSLVLEDLSEGTEQGLISALGCDFHVPSIDAAGSHIPFSSSCDLTGNNSDNSVEIFLFDTSTGVTTQISSFGTCCSCATYDPEISADGTRVVFSSDCNLTGGNVDGSFKVFLHDTLTGTTTQLPVSTTCGSTILSVSLTPFLSADGSRIVFASNCDPTGANPDGSSEFFALDGTEVRQLTNSVGCHHLAASLSADGVFLAFESSCDPTGDNPDGTDEIFLLDATVEVRQLTDTTGCLLLPGYPSLSADGSRLAFASTCPLVGSNVDGNRELFRVDLSGPSPTFERLTDSAGCQSSPPSSSSDGSRFALASDCDFTGENDGNDEIFLYNAEGDRWAQITDSTSCFNHVPSLSADATTVAFLSDCDLTGDNADGSTEIFFSLVSFASDGATRGNIPAVHQLTDSFGCINGSPAISPDGRHVAFVSDCDYIGANPDENREVYLWELGSDSPQQLTFATGCENDPVVGTGVIPIPNEDGSRVVFHTRCDLIANPDENSELYLWDQGEGLNQLNTTSACSNLWPSISADGRVVSYQSSCNPTGFNPDEDTQFFLLEDAEASLVRVSHPSAPKGAGGTGSGAPALALPVTQVTTSAGGCMNAPIASLSTDGSLMAFSSSCDLTGDNPDGSTEIFLARRVLPGVVPSETPTHTPTRTPTRTWTPTRTSTGTSTPTKTPSSTSTPTRTPTHTRTPTRTSSRTSTPTTTPSHTLRPTSTPTGMTPTGVPTEIATSTPPATPSETPTRRETGTPINQSPTPTGTATMIETRSPQPPSCFGDCSGDDRVTIDELVQALNIALGKSPLSECRSLDRNGDEEVNIEELVTAVSAAVRGCQAGGT